MFASVDGNAVVRFGHDGTVTSFVTEGTADAGPSADLWIVLALGWLLITLARGRTR